VEKRERLAYDQNRSTTNKKGKKTGGGKKPGTRKHRNKQQHLYLQKTAGWGRLKK